MDFPRWKGYAHVFGDESPLSMLGGVRGNGNDVYPGTGTISVGPHSDEVRGIDSEAISDLDTHYDITYLLGSASGVSRMWYRRGTSLPRQGDVISIEGTGEGDAFVGGFKVTGTMRMYNGRQTWWLVYVMPKALI